MTREHIEKEIDSRLDEPDNQWDGIFNSGYSRGFKEGAQWRINSVWHNMNEKPNGMFVILADFGQEEYSLGINLEGMESAKRWAYVSDLLPERKEKKMEVVKITRKVYKCLNVTDKPFIKFSKFREISERLGLKVQRCCFNCNHKFTDDEDMYLAMFKGTLNHFLCKKCKDKALSDLRKEETK